MKRILLVLYQNETSWMSCLKIHQGLIEIYHELGSVDILSLSHHPDDYFKFEKKLLSSQFDIIACVDHRLSPSKILNYFIDNKKISPLINKMKMIFHPFGAIKELKKDWIYFNNISTTLDIHIALPSEAQRSIYQNYTLSSESLHTIPCVISSDLRERIKKFKRQSITHDSLRIGYLGRISRLKNITPMIHLFEDDLRIRKFELHIAGPFDDYDKTDITKGVGYYMREFEETIRNIPNIHYHGVKKGDEVYKFLASLDGFCTLSTNPGEDFCFSVAEALELGLPCLVTNWMALKDHAKRYASVQLLDVFLNEKDELDITKIDKKNINDFYTACKGSQTGEDLGDIIFQTAKESLKNIINSSYTPFKGFNLTELNKL